MKNQKLYFQISVILVAIFLFSSNNPLVFAQELKGKITDEKNYPIYRAHIQLLRDGVVKNRAFTDWRGRYHIWPIGLGAYQALITVNGYDRIIRNIELKTIDTIFIDFTLHKKNGLLSK